jgi:hypothetical protein
LFPKADRNENANSRAFPSFSLYRKKFPLKKIFEIFGSRFPIDCFIRFSAQLIV